MNRTFRVKELARARGMTTEDLARAANLRISTVRNIWQNKVNDPAYSTLKAIAGALEVAIEELEVAAAEDSQSDSNGHIGAVQFRKQQLTPMPAGS